MASALKNSLLAMIGGLRAAGIRISVAESLDAMRAVAASGIERVPMREALRATLIKDESDNPAFDAVFARHFGVGADHARNPRAGNTMIGVSGSGRGDGGGSPHQAPDPEAESRPASRESKTAPNKQDLDADHLSDAAQQPATLNRDDTARGKAPMRPADRRDISPENRKRGFPAAEAVSESGHGERGGEIQRTPFASYSQLDYEQARDALAPIKRRFRARLGRRLRPSAKGRIDFRRTIRAGIQLGGAFADLRFRSRRPRHVELLILADISGSVAYASTLILEIAAGAREFFHRFHCFVYIDRLAEADFERTHLVMTPVLDLHARSDFGRVLSQLLRERSALLNRATVVVILGDARNNRRPPRADLLREVARRCRAVIWLNPEPISRWRTGDSALANYQPELDALVGCDNLSRLESALKLLSRIRTAY
jgi:uncharacterized protein with von Willebrand factor type A (vWA) domain